MSRPPDNRGGGRFDDYIPVAERLERFYERFPDGRILTTIIEHEQEKGFILMRAEVYRNPDDASPAATGHAFEVRGESHVNKTSYVENCETGACGRALALLGFEVKRSGNGHAPSQTRQQPHRRESPPPARTQAAPPAAPVIDENMRKRVLPSAADYDGDENTAEFMRLDEEILTLWLKLRRKAELLHSAINTQFKVSDGLLGLSGEYKQLFVDELKASLEAQQTAGQK